YKANMIIPQIAENLTGSSALAIPGTCPVCGGYTVIKSESGVETLNCPNPECPAKQIKGFAHFVSRDAMNVEGLSESTLEKLVDRGLIKDLADVFRVKDHHDEIVTMEGFGELSFKNLCDAVEKARKVTPQAFLYSLGIPNFGRANAGLVAKYCRNDWEKIRSLEEDELVTIEGIGDVMAKAYCDFFRDEKNIAVVDDLLTEVELDGSFEETGDKLAGMTFVITGSLETYPNRDALKEEIEANGGKVAGSVSAKTSYLINNDLTSNSGKNKKAKELGIPIISEADMVKWLKEDIKP
ncbi:MAG: NAD-dependent DNA ligase LigA, partial [Firmicutes bacterium]|nr:NAD-dependent DNA ligase LigA [Bacillota bacterium]